MTPLGARIGKEFGIFPGKAPAIFYVPIIPLRFGRSSGPVNTNGRKRSRIVLHRPINSLGPLFPTILSTPRPGANTQLILLRNTKTFLYLYTRPPNPLPPTLPLTTPPQYPHNLKHTTRHVDPLCLYLHKPHERTLSTALIAIGSYTTNPKTNCKHIRNIISNIAQPRTHRH